MDITSALDNTVPIIPPWQRYHSKASPHYPYHRVVTLNVSEVQFGESDSLRRPFVLLCSHVCCAQREAGGARVCVTNSKDHI